jgi:choline dehydrogenase
MVTIRPHDSDWDKIAELTGDESWCAKSMEKHFRQIERCHYVREPKLFWPHKGGHGFTGWMSTQIARPSLLKRDWKGQ